MLKFKICSVDGTYWCLSKDKWYKRYKTHKHFTTSAYLTNRADEEEHFFSGGFNSFEQYTKLFPIDMGATYNEDKLVRIVPKLFKSLQEVVEAISNISDEICQTPETVCKIKANQHKLTVV